MRFPYTRQAVQHPPPTLRGRTNRPRPFVPVTVIGPGGTWVRDGLLDTGADDTVFPESVAPLLGIDLSAAPAGTAFGIASARLPVRFAVVTLRVAAQQEQREWSACVGFSPAITRRPLFGFAGFLEFFDAHFFGAREVVELTINSSYPGT